MAIKQLTEEYIEKEKRAKEKENILKVLEEYGNVLKSYDDVSDKIEELDECINELQTKLCVCSVCNKKFKLVNKNIAKPTCKHFVEGWKLVKK